MKGEGVEPGAVVYTAALAECRWARQDKHATHLLQQMDVEGISVVSGTEAFLLCHLNRLILKSFMHSYVQPFTLQRALRTVETVSAFVVLHTPKRALYPSEVHRTCLELLHFYRIGPDHHRKVFIC